MEEHRKKAHQDDQKIEEMSTEGIHIEERKI